jgi:hypothetical protein
MAQTITQPIIETYPVVREQDAFDRVIHDLTTYTGLHRRGSLIGEDGSRCAVGVLLGERLAYDSSSDAFERSQFDGKPLDWLFEALVSVGYDDIEPSLPDYLIELNDDEQYCLSFQQIADMVSWLADHDDCWGDF